MAAIKEKWCEGDRVKLSDSLPLDTPVTIGIEASSLCNLRCIYCNHGSQPASLEIVEQLMDMDTFYKAVDSIKEFPHKIKNIVFAVDGEPLTNPRIAEMVAYVKKQEVAETVTLFTNAVLLTPQISDALIDAGLDLLRISLQGVNSQKYETMCQRQVDFDKLVENVRYFYEHKKNCKVFIKVVDKSLDSKEDEEKFFSIFTPIVDQISIENVVPIWKKVDFSDICEFGDKNMVDEETLSRQVKVCPQPFYAMYVRSNANVTACCFDNAIGGVVVGNVQTQSLKEIWNGDKLWQLRKNHLTGKRFSISPCSGCNAPIYGFQQNDMIDDVASKLYEAMSKARNEK